ncbi:hypothetical protein RIF29_35126 [Crotalaria pallida]|uniref:Uncharacterized protein n=1 Tax=Crotalaria pallida TaxID=3830 RepID=A0AAN9EBW4_CROPI
MEIEDQNGSLEFAVIQNLGQDRANADVEQNKKRVLERADLLNFGIQVISVMFVGHLGELALAGASMSNSFTSATGVSLLDGWECQLPWIPYVASRMERSSTKC